MKSLKTYQTVNKEDQKLSFAISKMEDIYTKRNGMADAPHRHNYYTVLVVKKAKGLHKVDFNSYDLDKNQIHFVAPGQVHQVIEKEEPRGFAMTFSTDFIMLNSISPSFISDLNLFQNYGQNPPLFAREEQFSTIEKYCRQIFGLFHSKQNYRLLSIGAYLKLLLIECSNICEIIPDELENETDSNSLVRNFKTEVDKHYRSEHSTSFYANQLSITPDHLNRSIKSKIGKTAKEYIQARIVTEAKRLLYFTDLSAKEIGYELGFNEPANFSAFFKKCTQSSPSNFKKKERND